MKARTHVTLISPSFFLLFLPLSSALYNAAPAKRRAALLLCVSILFAFFAFGQAAWILLTACVLTVALARFRRLAALPALCALCVCRFCSISCGGLAFLLLRAISYAFSRQKKSAPLADMTYLLAFPSLLMGPTALYPDFALAANVSPADRLNGLILYALGFFKKCAFADLLYTASRTILPGASALSAWITLTAFCLGLYFDFSGYTDMARGLAEMFGVSLPENFDAPFAACSVSDFFRRWHASFGRFLLTYVYLPLGGSKNGKARTLRSLLAVWLFSALWHGFSLGYLFWGLWFFLLSAAEKLLMRGRGLGNFPTLLCVWLGFVFFLCPALSDALAFFARLFCLFETPLCGQNDLYHLLRLAPLLLIAFLTGCGGFAPLYTRLRRAPVLLRGGGALFLFAVGLSDLLAGGRQPFPYAAF